MQRSQVDELFKSLKDGDEIDEAPARASPACHSVRVLVTNHGDVMQRRRLRRSCILTS